MLNGFQPASRCRRFRLNSGWTLVELMVAAAVSVIILGAVVITSIFIARSFVIMGNYRDLDKDSRQTLDYLSRDIRSISNITFFATNALTMVDVNGNQIGYRWDGLSNFTRTYNGTATVMLKDCDYLCMSNYQRAPVTIVSFVPATTASQTKLIDVRWHCWRPVLGAHLTTESVQTAKIVVRNY